MRNSKAEDKLVAPVPVPPAWPNDEARTTVITANQGAYHLHMESYQARRLQMQQMSAEIETLNGEVAEAKRVLNEAQHRLDEKVHAQREVARFEHLEWSSAQGYAVACAALGAPIPPPDGELSHDPDGKVARWSAAVDADRAADPERPL